MLVENLFKIYNSTCFSVVEKTKVYRDPKVIAHANQLLSMYQASFYTLYIFILPQPCKVDTVVRTLQIKKPRSREVKYLTLCCMVTYWLKWGSLLVTRLKIVELR